VERRSDTTAAGGRLVGAPISWGVCEVPGWGLQLGPDRVLSEMAGLGLRHTELGALGWLPLDGAAVREQLAAHDLDLVAGFVPVVVHEPTLSPALLAHVRTAARQLADGGAQLFVAALTTDLDWSPPVDLDRDQWRRLGGHLSTVARLVHEEFGLELVLHPHVGTLVENDAQVQQALAHTDVPWCFDSGHLLIGGTDPIAFIAEHADRIAHAHLKDVDATLAAAVRTNTMTLVGATQAGLFRPLGDGDARIDEVVALLEQSGYERWLVLEQDLAITGSEPPAGGGPVLDVRKSIEFLSNKAPRRERVQT
jgi:inosose dehydratase